MTISDAFFARRVRTMQIIAGAITGGLLSFAAVVAYLVDANGPMAPPPGTLPILSIVALLMLATCLPLSVFIPNMVLRGMVQRIAGITVVFKGIKPIECLSEEARLLGARQTTLIIAWALLESAGFMACIAYLLEGQTFALTTAAVTVVFLLFQFPTQSRSRAWLEDHLALIEELRQLGGPGGNMLS